MHGRGVVITSLSLPPAYLEALRTYAKREHDGNVSAAVRAWIEREMLSQAPG